MPDDGVVNPDPVLNRNQIAQIFGVSANTIDKWRAKGMPVEAEGGNGQAYEFLFSECQAWYEENKESERREKASLDDFVAKRQAEFLGIKTTDEQSRLTPRQVSELTNAQLGKLQLDSKRRKLVPVEEMVELLDKLFTTIRAALDGQPDWLDREFSLTTEQVVMVVEYNDGILKSMSEDIARAHLQEIELDGGDQSETLFS
ncbi:MAG: terminase small subunit [Rhodobacteraceae bacterium]|nr:terminase small subunit [Paracoccaceae bacterium]